MKYFLQLLILTNWHVIQGILEWTVVGKVTDYGQNVTLFCNVPHCCPKDSGWDRWTPVQQTLFIDVKTERPNKKYDGKVLKDGYTLIIQNLTKHDLNVSYSCLYGVTLGERKFLLEEDVFKSISHTQPNGQLSHIEISALIIGVIVLVLGSGTIGVIVLVLGSGIIGVIVLVLGSGTIGVIVLVLGSGTIGVIVLVLGSGIIGVIVLVLGSGTIGVIVLVLGSGIIGVIVLVLGSGIIGVIVLVLGSGTIGVIVLVLGSGIIGVIVLVLGSGIIGVIVLVLGSGTIVIYFCRRRIERHKSKGKPDNSDIEVNLLDTETEQKELVNNSDLTEKLIKIVNEQEQCIPKNTRVLGLIQRQIEDWKKKDEMFVSTKASDYVIECLQKNSCVTLTGPSGVGKSFISRHTALVLQKEGFDILPVYSPTDIRDYYQLGKQTVFIVDDICGNFSANQQQIENWKQLLPVINTIIADKCCKIIVSCRLQVYKDEKFNILSPFKSCECNLVSNKFSLTSVEKTIIAKKYIGTNMKDIDDLSHSFDFFPLLCSLYNTQTNVDVKEYFKNPFHVYKSELDKLCEDGDEGNYKLCSLALCVLFNNQLEEKWFKGKVTDEQRHIIEDACNACEINRSTSKAKLRKTLDTLDGTFMCKQNGIFKSIHDKLFDFLAHYFGQKMIECLIEHGDSNLVHERFIWQKSTNDKNCDIDFIIEIPDDYLESYLQRLIEDWLAGKVTVVFSDNNLQISLFRQKLLDKLKQLNKSKQVSLVNTNDTVIPKTNCASGNNPLVLTCFDGYTDMVQWMLRNDVDVDQCRDDGISGLLMASQEGHTDIIKLLLERNPDVNQCNKNGSSPLLQASQNGHTDIVKLLLERNPYVNLCNKDGVSPLLMASQNRHTDIVKLLLERKPDVSLCNKDGVSPLLMASQNRHTDIVKLLLETNPDVNLCDKDGVSPLLKASDKGYTDIVKLLLERNPDVNLCNNDGYSPLLLASQKGYTNIVKLLLERNADVNLCDNDGVSPLLQASLKGYTNIVKLLLERNADVNLCDKDGLSPLLLVSDNGHTDIVKLLLERNPDVNLCNNDGVSSLLLASQNGHTDIVRLLLEMNPDPCNHNIRISNSPSLVQSLLKHKPDINAQTYDGGNALYFSAKDGNIEITQLLLENNADSSICIYRKQFIAEMINNHPTDTLGEIKQELFDTLVRSKSSLVTEYVSQKSVDYVFDVVAGSSPLHIACFMGRKDIVNCLLDHNVNFNQKKEDGTTPLFYACEVGHEDIVQLLLHKGADSQISRLDGKSPLDITKYNGHTSIELILTEYKKMADQLAV